MNLLVGKYYANEKRKIILLFPTYTVIAELKLKTYNILWNQDVSLKWNKRLKLELLLSLVLSWKFNFAVIFFKIVKKWCQYSSSNFPVSLPDLFCFVDIERYFFISIFHLTSQNQEKRRCSKKEIRTFHYISFMSVDVFLNVLI